MKKIIKNTAKLIALVFGLTAAQAFANGDIFEIRPCLEDGTIVAPDYYATASQPITSGDVDLYFMFRLIEATYDGTTHKPWYLKPSAIAESSQSTYSSSSFWPTVSVIVGNEERTATLVSANPGMSAGGDYTGFTDLVVKFTTKTGDMALPAVLLALSDGTPANIGSSSGVPTYEFKLNPSAYWSISNVDGTTLSFSMYSTSEAGTEMAAGNVRATLGTPSVTDYTLQGCNFYVRTVEFNGEVEGQTEPWRTVYMGSTKTVEDETIYPTAIATVGGALSEGEYTYYVWTDDETSAFVTNVAGVTVVPVTDFLNYDGTTITKHVGKVTLKGNSTLSDTIGIYGVLSNTTCNLVLSPWPSYRQNAAGTVLTDTFKTIPIAVTEPQPTSIEMTVTKNVMATADYLKAVGTISLNWSDNQYTNDVDVVLVPEFTDAGDAASGAAWTDYFRLATAVDSSGYAEELPTVAESEAALTVTLPAYSTDSRILYIIAITADDKTRSNSHHFSIRATASAAQFPEQTETGRMPADKPLIIDAENPTVQVGTINPRQGDPITIPVSVSNVYADSEDTATGYTVRFCPDVRDSNNADAWTTFNGKYAMSPSLKRLVLLDAGAYTETLPSYTYAVTGVITSRVEVVSPITGLTGYYDFEVTIRPVRTATLVADASSYNEGEQMVFTVELSEKHTAEPLYAFLRVTKQDGTDLTDLDSFSETKCIITAESMVGTTSGWAVDSGSTMIYVPVQDGSAETKNLRFTLRLCTSQVYDAANDVTSRYKLGDDNRPSPLNLTLNNVAPVIPETANAKFIVNGYSLKSYIGTDGVPYLPKKLIPGEKLRITPDITDVDYDMVNNLKWTISARHHTDDADNTTEPPDPVEITNTTSAIAPYNDYELPGGKWLVDIYATDKDDADSARIYTFVAEVVQESKIKVGIGFTNRPSTYTDTVAFSETSTRETVDVTLPYYDGQNLLVKLTVTPPATGMLQLDSSYKQTAHVGYPDPGENEYYVLFRGSGTERISVTAMDGTTLSAAQGISVEAEVVTTNVYDKANIPWNEYYRSSGVRKVYIDNVAPEFGNCSTPNSETNAYRVAGGSAPALKWAVSLKSECQFDITNLWTTTVMEDGVARSVTTNGIKVTIDGCKNAGVFFADNNFAGDNFQPVFGSDALGTQTVTISIEDKDGDGPEQLTYYFQIVPAKYLTTVPNGPSNGNADISLSTKYANAAGIGSGHVWVSGGTFNGTENFFTEWNCNLATKVVAYAFGYNSSVYDRGQLNPAADGTSRDIWIDSAGNHAVNATVPATGEYYQNPDNYYDSFFYGWIKASEPGGTDYAISYGPQVGTNAVNTAEIKLPTALTEDEVGYLQTYAEAVFSREYSQYDQLGDINNDGIPDIFARYDYANGSLSTFDGQGGELPAVNSSNSDGDYYPSSSHIGETATPPGAVSGWETSGQGFTALREIRGYDDGLNYGMFKVNQSERKAGWISDLELSTLEKKALLREVFKRRDYLLNKLYTTQLTDDGYNNETYELQLVTNLLQEVYYAGASQAGGQTRFRMSNEDIADYTNEVEVVVTNVEEEVTTIVTNLVNAWIRTFRPVGAQEDTVITNFFAEAISNEITGVFHTPNPSDALSFEHVDYGAWLNYPENGNWRAQQETAKAWINYTWRHYERAKQWGFTVENRTDPTTDDTDGDEMPDGYEYYMWYSAMVGTGTNELTGCRFKLADVESYDDIIEAEDIRNLYNPNVHHTWTRTDTDNDGIYDYEEFLIGTSPIHWDSDRDGLSDLYEVVYNINPMSAAAGANGAANGDGDFMAFKSNPDGVTYGIYAVQNGDKEELWAIDNIVELNTNNVTQRVIGQGCQVAMLSGNYIPVTEDTRPSRLTRTVVKYVQTSVAVTNAPLTLYHHQVHNYYGFDPRTGWYSGPNGLASSRFGVSAGAAENTAAFTALNEFRLIKYRYIVGLANAADDQKKIDDSSDSTTMYSVILARTTNPSADFSDKTWGDSETKRSQSQHGADTDGDGVPDGWELYIGVNPNIKYTIPQGSPGYDTLYWDAGTVLPAPGNAELYTDGMALVNEYAGTDSCGMYSACSTVYANHPSQENGCMYKWYNKFMPTDPRNDDTDGDGLDDSSEGANWSGNYTINRWGQSNNTSKDGSTISGVTYWMKYGNPKDSGGTVIKGGGYNPCSIDTDGDALPDAWEHQYTGLVFVNDEIMTNENAGGREEDNFDVFPRSTGIPSEVYDDIRAAVSALGWWERYDQDEDKTNKVFHIVMGMDGTVSDAYSYSGLLSEDRDWDNDGLQNWQEYMVQAMRHFRYDDDKTPLLGRDIAAFNATTGEFEEGGWYGDKGFLKLDYATPVATNQYETLEELGYKNFVAYIKENGDYLRELGYFAAPPQDWDYAKLTLNYVYMLPPKCKRRYSIGTRKTANLAYDEDLHGIWGYATPNDPEYVMLDEYAGATFTNLTDTFQIYDPASAYADGTFVVITNDASLGFAVVENDPADPDVIYLDRIVHLVDSVTEGIIVTNTTYAASEYVGTDPRLWDTDEDGMDDYYELFHGLNPILGNAGTISTSVVTNSDGSVTTSTSVNGTKDIIADAYGIVTALRNGWTGWDNYERSPYDPIRYPWMMGEGMCDADGDGLRNSEESLTANLTPPMTYHTDPTPLWMTDATGSYTNYSAIVTEVVTNIDTTVSWRDPVTGQRVYGMKITTNVTEYASVALTASPSYAGLFYENFLRSGRNGYSTASAFQRYSDYFYSFEQNEGYDTDNDWRSDDVEMRKTAESTSDPLDPVDLPRRQSLWFGGESEPGAAISYEPISRNSNGYDFFKQFTVEAWVRSEAPATGSDQYIVSRASNYVGWDLANSNDVIRMNFALGIDASGNLFGEMQNSTDTSFRLTGGAAEEGVWTHLAATYDGVTFRVYVNGVETASMPTDLIPANGVISVLQDPQFGKAFPYEVFTYEVVPSITVLGARAANNGAFNVTTAAAAGSWDNIATDFFKGSVAEVRVWDGARSASDIAADRDVRYTVATAKALRDKVYNEYRTGSRRTYGNLSPELVQHYGFDSLPGATETDYVVLEPAGFASDVLGVVRNPDTEAPLTDAVKVGWWSAIAENANIGSVYSSPHVVPWIENTVTHLPRLCGSVADSVFWSEHFAGYTPSQFQEDGNDNPLEKFSISNSMNPYNIVNLNDEENYAYRKYYRVSRARYAGGSDYIPDDQADTNYATYRKYLYDRRMSFTGTSDLVPLGSAYAKRLSESWDGEGPEDAWTRTTDGSSREGDLNNDGIPQWAIDAGYTTIEDYLADLSNGLLPDGKLYDEYSRDYYFTELAKRAFYDDANGNEIPDWWETYFGIKGCDKNGDEDNDGLSNYQEFFISFGDYSVTTTREDWSLYKNGEMAISQARNVGMPLLSPVDAHSTGEAVIDYFLKPDFDEISDDRVTANSYLGEMVTDNDMMEMWWELKNNVDYSNAFVYDPMLDKDGDGWNNFAEARAYSWYGAFRSSDIDGYYAGSGDNHYDAHPKPAIGVRVTYNGVQDINAASLVVRTSTETAKRIDATFVVRGSSGSGSVQATHMLGTYQGDTVAHGFLHPGHIVPGSDVEFASRRLDAEPVYYWTCTMCENVHNELSSWDWYDEYVEPYQELHQYGYWVRNGQWSGSRAQYYAHRTWHGAGNIVLDDTSVVYETFAQTASDEVGQYGTINLVSSNNTETVVIGKIDFTTGEYEIDLGAAVKAGVALDANVIRVTYSYQLANEWPKTVWLSDTSVANGSGYVREGKNTVEAFIDLNNSGTYDIGEPYGALRDVDISWHKTGEPLVIELSDDSAIVQRVAIPTETSSEEGESATVAGGLTTSIVVRRSAINGDTSASRKLSSRTLVLDDRAYVTEADVLAAATSEGLDIDWKWLSVDATNRLGKSVSVRNATYEITVQGSTEPIGTFTRTFSSSRGKAQILSPITSAPVYSARPKVVFASDDESMTVYCLQIATSASEEDVIWESGTRRLPGRTPYSVDNKMAYEVKPEIYVDTYATTNGTSVFADGGTYYLRVALLNSKYNYTDDDCWSDWAEFQMDVGNNNQNPDTQTGYGNVAAAVRYYGAGAVSGAEEGVTNIVVEAYATADFTGAPLARTRVASLEGLDSASDIATTNAVLRGIAPGTVYLMAYIDSNNNCKRDAWESWGYANRLGENTKFLYTPKAVEVSDVNSIYPAVTIYIEDADLNRNEIPDILEGPVSQSEEVDPTLVDSDGDGLYDTDETDYYGTDPYNADTDGDGIPDGYEVATGTDPLTDDADDAGMGDYMAYAEVDAYVLETNGVAYVLNVDKGLAYETVPLSTADGRLVTTRLMDEYPIEYIAGAVTNAISRRSVVLVHSAVNDWFGYDSTTARDPATLSFALSDDDTTSADTSTVGPNTVPFTAFWKYFTTEFYLPAYGIELDPPLSIASIDYGANGLPDGWELYVKFAADVDPDKPDDEYLDDFEDETDPNTKDTDGDGIPDNEEREIGTNPKVPDADKVLEGDVMAYAEIKRPIITVDRGLCEPALDVVIMEGTLPAIGQILTASSTDESVFCHAYKYGTESNYVWAAGRTLTIGASETWRVTSVNRSATVALIHSQVYDAYGFNPLTANATVDTNDWVKVNSKEFSALDKSLVTTWLEEIGMSVDASNWKQYTLSMDTVDANGNGLPDGWELYVMFGPAGTASAVSMSVEDAQISPWTDKSDADDPTKTPDRGGLSLVDEYDGGNNPTDPWNRFTDDSAISDLFLKAYHLKGDDAGEDYDGDGLSNYAEYLITEVFQFAQLDPENAMSNATTLDYYQKFGELYFGELFSDHDRVGDEWEAKYEYGDIEGVDYASRGIYDPNFDLDGDGWSNYAEFRAGTDPSAVIVPAFDIYNSIEYPVPVVDLELIYNGSQPSGTVTVKAWSESAEENGGYALGAPDAVWTVETNGAAGVVREKFVGLRPNEKRTYYLGPGGVKAGTFKLCVMDRNFVIGTLMTVLGEQIPMTTGYGKADNAKWYTIAIDQNGLVTTIGGRFAENAELGSLDLKTGRLTIDFTNPLFEKMLIGNPEDVYGGSGTTSDSDEYEFLDLRNSYVKLVWESAGAGMGVSGRYYLSDASGHLREGKNTFVVEVESDQADTDTTSTSTSHAALYGFASGVDVGWAGARVKIELTDFSGITPRINLLNDTSDRTESVYTNDYRVVVNDPSNKLETVTLDSSVDRVRVVRYAINGYPSYESWGNSADVVLDREYYSAGRTKLSELDFLGDDEFDIDWATLRTEIINNRIITSRAASNLGRNITNMCYLVVIGNGHTGWRDNGSANTVYAHKALITRHFDLDRAIANNLTVDSGILYGARPTFSWRIDNESEYASKYGTSYTAFRLLIQNSKSNMTVYDSGRQRMPTRNAAGDYVWTAPACVGDLMYGGDARRLFAPNGSYYARLMLYNAKFSNNDQDAWTPNSAPFSAAVGQQQEINDHGYSSIKAAVKYAGHSLVLKKYGDLSTMLGKVRVQAFPSGDFAGAPLASVVVTNGVAAIDDASPNAVMRGLAANGTYYVRAFIDMDGDGQLSEFEPWGYVKGDVELSSSLHSAPVVSVWIEDADTDGDWYPDAYEFAAYDGWAEGTSLGATWDDIKGNKRIVSSYITLQETGVDGDDTVYLKAGMKTSDMYATLSKGLPGASITTFQSKNFVSMLFAGELAANSISDMNEAAKAYIKPNSFKISSMVLDRENKQVVLTVNAEVTSGIAGTIISRYFYFPNEEDSVTVSINVYKKSTLVQADWDLVATVPAVIKNDTAGTIVVKLGSELDLSSGFFKLEAVEAGAGE